MKFSRDSQDLIWVDYGPHYVKVRKVCTLELFTLKRLKTLRPIREDEVTAMVESIFNDCTNPGIVKLPEQRLCSFFVGVNKMNMFPKLNACVKNVRKSVLVKKCLGEEAFNNITRLVFGKRFVNSEGVMDKQGQELKAIVANGLNLGASLAMAEHIPWILWMFPLEEEAFSKNGAHRDKLTRAIMGEHTLGCKETGGAGRRVCPSAQLGDIHVRTPATPFIYTHFNGVKAEEIDMLESPGLVTYMKTPLQAVATPRLPSLLYKRIATDM